MALNRHDRTVDKLINGLADALYGRNDTTVDLTPVYNEYENREDLRDIRCEIQKIHSVTEDCDKAIASIIYTYISYGVVAEGDEKLKKSESVLLTLNRILNDYEKYLSSMKDDLETEQRRFRLIFKEDQHA